MRRLAILDRLKWSLVRWRLEARAHPSILLKIQLKVIHLLRRTVVFVATLFLRKYSRTEPLDILQVRSVLILPNFPIGDLLLSSTLWHALKRRNPKIRIGVIVSPRNAAMISRDSDVDQTYMIFGKNLWSRIRETLRARNDRWEVVLTTVGFFKPTRFGMLMRFIARDGVTASTHEAREKRYHGIYSYCFRRSFYPYPQPMVPQFQEVAELTFDFKLDPSERAPHYALPEGLLEQVNARLDALKTNGTTRVVVMNVEAKRTGLEWGLENVAEFAERFTALEPGALLLITASPMFVRVFPQYTQLGIERVHYFPTSTMDEVIALIGLSDLIITPDTAIVHFAAIAKKPMLLLFERETEWLPFEADFDLLTSGAERQVSLIPVDLVISRARELLHKAERSSNQQNAQ